jgi:hypothetical protein
MRRLNDGRGPRSTSIRFTKPTVARILIRASAFNSRGVTTVRKSRCCRGLECGNLHGRARQRGKTRRTDLAWRRREHLRSSHVGGSRNHKDPHQRSWQEEHAVCLHAVQIYDRSKRNVSLLAGVPSRFVLCRQVLIGIVKIGRTYRFVPFDVGAWSPVGDHFGDHFVHWRFATDCPLECYPE